jgi:hypothetical protein
MLLMGIFHFILLLRALSPSSTRSSFARTVTAVDAGVTLILTCYLIFTLIASGTTSLGPLLGLAIIFTFIPATATGLLFFQLKLLNRPVQLLTDQPTNPHSPRLSVADINLGHTFRVNAILKLVLAVILGLGVLQNLLHLPQFESFRYFSDIVWFACTLLISAAFVALQGIASFQYFRANKQVQNGPLEARLLRNTQIVTSIDLAITILGLLYALGMGYRMIFWLPLMAIFVVLILLASIIFVTRQFLTLRFYHPVSNSPGE